MKKKHFDRDYLWDLIWNHADRDGIWDGDAELVAAEFGVTEDTAHSTLGELCDSRLIERLEPAKYIVVNWPETDEPGESSA